VVVVDDDVTDGLDEIGGMILKVIGYDIEEGWLELTNANGSREYNLYPDEIARHYEEQVC
jgi:hypothetical protein